MAIKLRRQTVLADAPRELCFEVVAAAGHEVDKVSDTERIVEFKPAYRGREVVTLERLRLTPPARIDYEWLKGPLSEVRESIAFGADARGGTKITYEGSFEVTGSPLTRIVALLWIRPTFNRIVLEHLEQAKEMAEKRADRSHIYRRERDVLDENPTRTGGNA